MSRKDELLALAERVEALTGPDRGVDAEVGRYFAAQFLGYAPWEPQTGCAKFTASLDAAMSLVPDGYWWNVGHVMGPQPDTQNMFWAMCHFRGAQWPYDRPIAATPALALTAAALRAIAETEEQQP
jgi:hypothetical protein